MMMIIIIIIIIIIIQFVFVNVNSQVADDRHSTTNTNNKDNLQHKYTKIRNTIKQLNNKR
jgi:peptidoglycan hydrolase CwlO-like protein